MAGDVNIFKVVSNPKVNYQYCPPEQLFVYLLVQTLTAIHLVKSQ